MSTPAHPNTDAMPEGLARALPGGRTERALQVDRAAVDEAARTATLAFASEYPYERAWGIEILDCTATAMRQGRLRAGANLLCDHDARDVVGVIESVSIGADRVGRAVVRFGKSARAEEVFRDVVDGIRRNVSVGYLIHQAQLVDARDGLETYRVTDWEPYEVSLVSIPADPTVGIGRSAAVPPAAQKGICINVSVEVEPDGEEDDAEDDASVGSEAEATQTPPTTESTQMTDNVQVSERNHAAEISKIAASIPGGAELAMSAIQRGLTVEAFQREALESISSKPLPTADIGMDKRETRRYSMLRALNALASPSDASAQRAAAFEMECSDAVAKKLGKQSRGLFVPFEVQHRDLTAGTGADGGYTVATNVLGGSMIDALRNALVLPGIGAQFLTGLVGNIAIPKLSAGATAYWVAENGAPTESQQTMAQVTMSPKTVGAYTDVSRRLLLQSSIDVEGMVQNDLATTIGLALQQAAINGSGSSNQPSGIITQVGAATVAGGTNGAAPTFAHIVALESAVAAANADVGTLAYLTNAKVRGKLKVTEQFSGTNGMPVWVNGDTPLNGYRTAVTNAVPSNLTKGTASGTASAIIFGNFADLLIGLWGGMDLQVDPYTGGAAGTVRVRILQDADIAVRNAVSFATMLDALTA